MRTHVCAEVNESLVDQVVTVSGWVGRRRDHGGVIFIDLRDASSTLQVVIDPDAKDAFKLADSVRNEFVIEVTAKVRNRPEGTQNRDLATGMVEVYATKLEILNRSAPIPFQLDEDDVSERYVLSIGIWIYAVTLCKKLCACAIRLLVVCVGFLMIWALWISKHRY